MIITWLKNKKAVLLILLFAIFSTNLVFSYSGALSEDIYKISQKSYVKISFTFKNTEISPAILKDYYDIETLETDNEFTDIESFLDNDKSFEAAGVLISADGKIVMPEVRLPLANIGEITAENLTGEKKKAELLGVYNNAPLMLLKLQEPFSAETQPLQFSDEIDFNTASDFTGAMIEDVYGSWKISGDKLDSGYSMKSQQPQLVYYTHLPFYYPGVSRLDQRFILTPGIIFNKGNKPVGVFSTSEIDDAEIYSIWKGKSLLNNKVLAFSDFKNTKKEWRNILNNTIFEIKIEFRKTSKDKTGTLDSWMGDVMKYGGYSASDIQNDITYYGVPIDEKQIFVPAYISSLHASLIKSIVVTIPTGENETKTSECDFTGAFQDIAGFVLKVKDDTVKFDKKMTLNKDFQIPDGRLFYTCYAKKYYGEKLFLIQNNKVLMKSKGYGDQMFPIPLHNIENGSFILNDKGEVCGVYTFTRIRGAEIYSAALGIARYREKNALMNTFGDRAFFYGEKLSGIFANLKENFDPAIMYVAKGENKPRAWFGIEFNNMNFELAKSLGIEKETRNGEIGLMVSDVYKNSPADKIGIKKDDILLAFKVEGLKRPVELISIGDAYDLNVEDDEVPQELRGMGFNMPARAPWRAQNNYINNLTDKIGVNKKVELTYISGKEIKTSVFTTEESPNDYLNAPKFKSEETGLTVKNMTYEVRKAMGIDENNPGVVIAEIEEGSPAAIARLNMFEIITHVDGVAVNKESDFEACILKSKENKAQTINVQILNMGKTRFADLQMKW